MKVNVYFFVLFLFFHGLSHADTCTATMSGNWEDAGIWSCGHVPLAGDSVYINAGDTVTITNPNLSYADTMYIEVSGGLQFDGGKLILIDGSEIILNTGGSISSPDNGNNDKIRIGGNTVWTTHDGNLEGPLVLNSGGVSLKVHFLSVSATQTHHKITIDWTVILSHEQTEFLIQENSNGTWTTMETFLTNKMGEQNLTHTYQSQQNQPSIRIIGNDIEGKYSSKIVKPKNDNINSSTIYPNPAKDRIIVEATVNEELTITCYNIHGENILNRTIENNTSLDISNLKPGIYSILISSPSLNQVQKLIIK